MRNELIITIIDLFAVAVVSGLVGLILGIIWGRVHEISKRLTEEDLKDE